MAGKKKKAKLLEREKRGSITRWGIIRTLSDEQSRELFEKSGPTNKVARLFLFVKGFWEIPSDG